MLRNYIYIDNPRLDMFVEQIAASRPKDKKVKKTVGLSLTGPKVEASEESTERSLTTHEKIELLTKYLRENLLLDTSRPKGGENRGELRFILETMDARKIIVPEAHLKSLPGVKHFAVWISDPDPQDYNPVIRNNVDVNSRFREPSDYHVRGTFVYLTEAWLDNDAYGRVYSGCSALQAIANALDGRPLIGYGGAGGELLGCGSFDHPIVKLEGLGAVRGDVRRITSLYYKRYMINEQCYVVDGQERCVNDLLGYPIFIAEEG